MEATEEDLESILQHVPSSICLDDIEWGREEFGSPTLAGLR